MKLRLSLAAMILAAPVFGQNCGSYPVVGSQCAMNILFPWGTAGLGTDSLMTIYVPNTVSAPITFQTVQLNSSLGSTYTGFFGTMDSSGKVSAGGGKHPAVLSPGQGGIFQYVAVCFDPTCTSAPPAGAVANMFSWQLQVLGASAADLEKLPPLLLTVRFLNPDGSVSFEEQETAVSATPTASVFAVGLAEAAAPANRYVYSGTAVTLPFNVFSVTNPSTSQSIAGTAYLYGQGGTIVAQTAIPAIPPLGAVGYLLVGRFPGDTLGLFPSSTVIPVPSGDTTGVFYGELVVAFNAPAAFLAQSFDGYAMLNLVIFQ
jgi:hypothetical protein